MSISDTILSYLEEISIIGGNDSDSKFNKTTGLQFVAILDFEATCDNVVRINPTEIIEWPTVVLSIATREVVNIFHEYVTPLIHPKLTEFCTELTGITQEMVDNGKPFVTVYDLFLKWVEKNGYTPDNIIFVTCGDWDLKNMMPSQCLMSNLPVPKILHQWINIKHLANQALGVNARGMMGLLEQLSIKHVGKHHSGIDDCRNLANIASYMLEKGVEFNPTMIGQIESKITELTKKQNKLQKKLDQVLALLKNSKFCENHPDKVQEKKDQIKNYEESKKNVQRYLDIYETMLLS